MRRASKITEDSMLLDPQWYHKFAMHRCPNVQGGQTMMQRSWTATNG